MTLRAETAQGGLMKILYSHRTRSADGQRVHIDALTKALSARGAEIMICGPGEQRLITPAGEGQAPVNTPVKADTGAAAPAMRKGEPKGLAVQASTSAGWGRRAPALYEMAEFFYSVPGLIRLQRAASQFLPDVIYERYNLFYHAGAILARLLQIPLILEVNAPLADERAAHGDLALKGFARWGERSIWRAGDAVLPVTGVLGGTVAQAGVAPDKITVILNGVDHSFLDNPDGIEIRQRYGLNGKLVLGFTGFVRDWHGVDRVLNYIAAAGRKDLHLLLVGDGPARADLERQASRLGIFEQFTATGVVQRSEIADYVAAFDIALQPAVVDYASPLKLFEYMALGKAVIAPDSANIKEVVKDGEDAILFERDNEEALHKALARLIDDGALRARLGAAARAGLLERQFTWDDNAAKVEAIAERLLAERASRRAPVTENG